jgi:ligand-binding sensor domain-containing protein
MVNNGDFISSCSAYLLKFIGLITLFVCSHATAYAQDFEVHPSFVLDQWTVNDGLPVNNVVDILQAENGYLWMATFDGLVRFDGVKFKVFQSEQYPGLPSNRILSVDEALDGSIWMTTEPGFVVYLKDGEFHRATEQNGLNGNLANEYTFIDHEGILWIPSNKGISTFNGETLAPYRPEKITGNIQNVFVEKTGAVWYRMFDDPYLFRVSGDEIRRFDYPLKSSIRNLPMYEDPKTGWIWVGKISDAYVLSDNVFEYHSSTEAEYGISGFYRDPHGKMWMISEKYDAYVWNEEWQNWETQLEGSLGIKRNNFLYSRDENLWFITGKKIFEDENKIKSTSDLIYSYLFDREGSLWLGTETSGLVRLKKNLFNIYTENDGMPWANVYTIIEDYANNIWAGTYRSGVGVIDQIGVVDIVGIEETAFGGFITSLFMGQDSTIYAGSIGAGLSWIEPGKHIFRKEENTGPDTPIDIKAIYEDRNGNLWLGTPNGLFIGEKGAWNKVDEQRFRNFEVRAITEAPDGSLWLGTNGGGIVRFHEDEFTFYGMEEGFTSNIFRSFYITDIQSEQEYTLWVGTEDRGLVRVEIQDGVPNLQTLTRYGTQIGMLDFAIHNIQQDDFGFFLDEHQSWNFQD